MTSTPWRVARLLRPALAASLLLGLAPAGAARPDPTDPAAPVPALSFRSSLSDFKRGEAVTARAWREVNDEVAAIGGWRQYLREAHAPEPAQPRAPDAAPASRATSSPPRAMGHGHDHGHGAPKAPKAPAQGAAR